MKVKHHHTNLCYIKQAMQRLKTSDTPLKRRNARKALLLVMQRTLREWENEYPLLREDGTEIVKPKKPCCPVCGSPMKSWAKLAEHLEQYHIWKRDFADPIRNHVVKCPCGKEYGGSTRHAAMGRHLRAQKDIKAHILVATIRSGGP